MKASFAAALFSLFASLALAEDARSECLHVRSSDLAQAAVCGDKAVLRNCLADTEDEFTLAAVESCFVKAGCTQHGAEVEARWIIKFCDSEAAELKRRRPVPVPGPTPPPAANNLARQATTPAAAPTSSLVCSTQTTTSIQMCQSTNHYECSMTAVPTMVCAQGLLCMQDAAGNNLCMRREDALTPSGTVVTIILAILLTLMISAIIFLCCRDKQAAKAAERKIKAAEIAKQQAVSRPETSQAQGGGAPGNPFADANRAH